MKALLFSVLVFLFLFNSCKEQSTTPPLIATSGWEKIGNLPGNFQYLKTKENKIYLVCYQDGYKFGISEDSGKSWQVSNINYLVSYNGFLNVQGDVFFIAGYDGLLKSYDKGQTWTEDLYLRNFVGSTYSIPGLTSIFVDSNEIFIGNNKTANMPGHIKGIFYSSDNGETWSCPGSIETPWRVVTLEKMEHILFISDGKVYYSSDSLNTWYTANGFNNYEGEIENFTKVNSRVYGLSYSHIKYSDFYGTSWKDCSPLLADNQLILPNTFTFNDNKIFFVDGKGVLSYANQSDLKWKIFDDKLPEFGNGIGTTLSTTLFNLDNDYLFYVNGVNLWKKRLTE